MWRRDTTFLLPGLYTFILWAFKFFHRVIVKKSSTVTLDLVTQVSLLFVFIFVWILIFRKFSNFLNIIFLPLNVFEVSECVSGLTSWPIEKPRDVLKASRAYRDCVLRGKKMSVPEEKKLRPNENGEIEVKFTLLKKLADIETPENYRSCKNYTKRSKKVICVAQNLKVYLRTIESEHKYKFKFDWN